MDDSRSFGWPFLVTLAGIGLAALLGACEGTLACQVRMFTAGPILLVVILVTGLAAGRLSASPQVGLGAILAATGMVVASAMASGLWDSPSDPEAQGAASDIVVWLFLAALTVGILLPGFLIGRAWRVRSEVARLTAARDAGTISEGEFYGQMVSRGRARRPDQAPPGHRCGRCDKPLSPVWRGKCQHCKAQYAEFPPVPGRPPN